VLEVLLLPVSLPLLVELVPDLDRLPLVLVQDLVGKVVDVDRVDAIGDCSLEVLDVLLVLAVGLRHHLIDDPEDGPVIEEVCNLVTVQHTPEYIFNLCDLLPQKHLCTRTKCSFSMHTFSSYLNVIWHLDTSLSRSHASLVTAFSSFSPSLAG
jgi:hypothetical protein